MHKEAVKRALSCLHQCHFPAESAQSICFCSQNTSPSIQKNEKENSISTLPSLTMFTLHLFSEQVTNTTAVDF